MKRKMILVALFLAFAPSLWGASDVPLATERAAKPLDNIGIRYPAPLGCTTDADCTKDIDGDPCTKPKCLGLASGKDTCVEQPLYDAGSAEEKCCKAGVYETAPEWLCCAKGDPKGCDDGNICTDDTCGSVITKDGAPVGSGVPTCLHSPNDSCKCAEKYKGNDEAIKCCDMGFDTDPAKQKCCVQHVTHKEDPGTPTNPIPCNGCPECPKCPPPPKIDCDLIGDKMKDCCVAKGGLLWFVMSSCVEHGPGGAGDCTNIAEHITNSGTFQQCCLINNGVITGDINMCNNNWTPGGGPSPTGGTTTGTPTTPAALGACQVQCKDADCNIAVDTGGQGVGWVVTYSPPPGIGAVASVVLKQVEGPAMTAEEPAPSGTSALSIKTITDPSSLPPFIVYTAKPASLQGEYLPKFKLTVQLNDLADHELAMLTCGNDTALEAKGSGGCGCSMTDQMTTREQVAAYAVILALFTLPQLLFRYARKRAGDHDGN